MSVGEKSGAESVAIIGMACRFPGADSVEAFWRNLREGNESITFFTDEELLEAGIPAQLLADPSYVKAAAMIDGVELFDADFFGFSPRDAEILDPQHRIFMELAVEALERAGHGAGHDGPVGVFGGTSMGYYLVNNLATRPDVMAATGGFQALLANDRDYFSTRISYKLDLKGPSVNVQTACSTSLVALHLACQSLLDYQCDLALAGGVRVYLPQKSGYSFEPGSIFSPDGHCRAFDAQGAGAIFGNGAGIVVLKRLDDALEDGDPIEAVVLASAVNNDGSDKVSYSAPSVEGQAEVIAMAHTLADVEPGSIGYVEAHGSGTPLGDPIEVTALEEAFGEGLDPASCAIGSVKTNFGHLESAAGVAGLIKTVLSLKHRELPPSLHCEEPNPKIDFAASPFYVNTELSPWPDGTDGRPRRAGVSSFGVGGTNVHVVLEEAPPRRPSGGSRPCQLLLVSARTETALETATDRLADDLAAEAAPPLADAAFTLQVGRRAHEHRRALICRDREDGVTALRSRDPRRLLGGYHEAGDRPVTFLFSGLGDHYPGMSRELYRDEEVFRDELDRCLEWLEPRLGLDLREVLYPEGAGAGAGGLRQMLGHAQSSELDRTAVLQPAMFAVEYALAKLWRHWGIEPQAVVGYSLGEYVAACVAGVFSLEDALTLVAERARLIGELPEGAMLAVPMSEQESRPLLGAELDVSAINGPQTTVVAGPAVAVEALEQSLTAKHLACRRLPTTHAFHSRMMRPASAALTEAVRRVGLETPKIPILSNLTGDWMTDEEATDPGRWARHMVEPVRFGDGVARLWRHPERLFLSIGPGQGLSSLVLQHPSTPADPIAVPTLPATWDRTPEAELALTGLAKLWLAGVEPDWEAFWSAQERLRVPLSTYPFERRRFWVDPGGATARPAPPADGSSATAADRSPALAPPAVAKAPELHERPRLAIAYAAPEGETERQVAGIWQQLLGISGIGRHDSFFDLGGNSLVAPRIFLKLRDDLGLELPFQVLFEGPTVAELSAAVEKARSEGVEAVLADQEQVDLAEECVLDPEVVSAAESVAFTASPSAVFVTGATGFVGAFLIDELLARTSARIYCLARAEDEASALLRVRQNLEHRKVWREGAQERLVGVPGDLAEPRFGLAPEAFEKLAGEVDAVYHAGAWVNFTYPYKVLKGANVLGTQEALRLAGAVRNKPLHFVSSISVFAPDSFSGEGLAFEDSPLEATEGLFSGYAESKWVAEKLVSLARERGITSTIHRPGVIGGHSKTGSGNTSDMVWNIMRGCLQLGSAFLSPAELDVASVDYVARALVALSLDERSLGVAFHYPNKRPMAWDEVFTQLAARGYPVRLTHFAEWREELLAAAQRGDDNALIPFIPLLPALPEPNPEAPLAEESPAEESPGGESLTQAEMALQPRHDGRNTQELLAGTSITCPPIDVVLLGTYADYFVEIGFFDAPPQSGQGEPHASTSPRELIEVEERINAAFAASDAADIAAQYCEDAVLMPPDRAPIFGRAGIRALYERAFERVRMRLVQNVAEAEVIGDVGILRGTFEQTTTSLDGNEDLGTLEGKYLVVLKRQDDGSWKFSRDIFNSNRPG